MKLKEVLNYHIKGRPGKLEIRATKPLTTQLDLGLAYTPGVAMVCNLIAKNKSDSYLYTAKANLVAVVSNGTAVLGLGNIGADAAKPVMEGKAVLFKKFGDVDVFDIEIDEKDPDKLIDIIRSLEPTFGGINLEDIKAPECFYIEERLKKIMNIPVFHDDQHGTAIVTGAAVLNAIELTGKDIKETTVVASGAGAAGLSCLKLLEDLGINHKNITVCDSKGVIYKGRPASINKYKAYFEQDTDRRTLSDAMEGADIFLGVSKGNIVSKAMVKSMNDKPIIFAMANPTPEISYDDAREANPNAIFGTGRSDYPNQINNLLVFPFIFRGALDVRATAINNEMQRAATYALARLAKIPVPPEVMKAYGDTTLSFGPDYIIPKPFDHRLSSFIAPAVAKAAVDTGVAKIETFNLGMYKEQLEERSNASYSFTRGIYARAKADPQRILFTEADADEILLTTEILLNQDMAKPVLIGKRKNLMEKSEKKNIDIDWNRIDVIDPDNLPFEEEYAKKLHEKRQRKGMTYSKAKNYIKNRKNYLAAMMLNEGYVDAVITGQVYNYAAGITPFLRILKDNTQKTNPVVAGVYIMLVKDNIYVLSDTTININPDEETLARITVETIDLARKVVGIDPVVAMLSFSNFGETDNTAATKIRNAVEIARSLSPNTIIDGEIQANVALDSDMISRSYPFSKLNGHKPNVLIFPNLDSANIAYKLLYKLGGAIPIGPILTGLPKSVHILERGSSVDNIMNMVALASVDAQNKKI